MESKSCYSCKYFIRHYAVRKYSISPLNCGHCIKQLRKSGKGKAKFSFDEGCAQWAELVSNDDGELSMVKTLNKMAKDVHYIALILKMKNRQN